MRYYIIFIFSISLIFAGCSREDFEGESEVEEIVPPSEELIVGDVNGVVKNRDGALLEAAVVQLFNEDSLVQETTTNAFGEFKFVDVFKDYEYRLFVKKEAFSVAISVISGANDDEDLEINLFEELHLSPFPLPENPLDPNFVIIYGEITSSNGIGVDAELALLSTEDDFYFQSQVVNGKYAMFVPKGEAVKLIVFQFDACQLFPEPILLPALTEDQNIDFKSNSNFEPVIYSGTIAFCDSTLFNGQIEYFYNGVFVLENIVNGAFEIEVNDCGMGFLYFSVFDELGTFIYSGQLIGSDNNHNVFIDCNIIFPFDEPIDIQIGQNVFQVSVFAFWDQFTNEVFVYSPYSNNNISFFFNMDNSNSSFISENSFNIFYENVNYTNKEPLLITYEIIDDQVMEDFAILSISVSGDLYSLTGEIISFLIEDEIPIFIN